MKISGTISVQYCFDYSITDTRTPDSNITIVFLHGAGNRGHEPFNIIKEQGVLSVYPVCKKGFCWESNQLAGFILDISNIYNIDLEKIFFVGHSMGARGVWNFAADYPAIPAGIIPISGYSCYLKSQYMAHIPCWAFHSKDDQVVPSEETIKMVSSMTEFGGKPRVTILPSSEHDILIPIINYNGIYKWMRQIAYPVATL